MNNAASQHRLEELIAALGRPSVAPTPLQRHETVQGADEQRVATVQIDELLKRVTTLSGVMGAENRTEWDDVDRIAARLLLADLAVVASTSRALNAIASSRLTTALADLVAARRDAERSIQEAG